MGGRADEAPRPRHDGQTPSPTAAGRDPPSPAAKAPTAAAERRELEISLSIKVMSAVWEAAEAEGGTLLVLLALADFSNDHGVSWPAVATLARKARLEERQTRYILGELQKDGLIQVEHNAGPKGTNVYTLTLGGAENAPLQSSAPEGGQSSAGGGLHPSAPEPSLEPSLEPSADSSSSTVTRSSKEARPKKATAAAAAGPVPTISKERTDASEAGNIFRLYQEHIGTFDAYLAQKLEEAEHEYTEECIRHAFEEASTHNARSWAYVEAILKRHKMEGCYGSRVQKDRPRHGRAGARAPAGRNQGPDLERWRDYANGGE